MFGGVQEQRFAQPDRAANKCSRKRASAFSISVGYSCQPSCEVGLMDTGYRGGDQRSSPQARVAFWRGFGYLPGRKRGAEGGAAVMSRNERPKRQAEEHADAATKFRLTASACTALAPRSTSRFPYLQSTSHMTIVSQKGASKPSVRTPQLVRVETSPDRKADNALPLSCVHNKAVAESYQRAGKKRCEICS